MSPHVTFAAAVVLVGLVLAAFVLAVEAIAEGRNKE